MALFQPLQGPLRDVGGSPLVVAGGRQESGSGNVDGDRDLDRYGGGVETEKNIETYKNT